MPIDRVQGMELDTASRWSAAGRAELDLPGWTRALRPGSSAIVSQRVPIDLFPHEAISDAAQRAFVSAIRALPGPACRMWAFLPRPTEHDGDTLSRYMRFNIGRTAAYAELTDALTVMPAGTCVGHAGADLIVYAMWIDGPLAAVENPRQRPAWQYSPRYGPVSPAFTRGVRAGGHLIAAGTASIVEEDSHHRGSLTLQFEETVRNLSALAIAGGATGPWRSMQMYVRDAVDVAPAEALAASEFGGRVERIVQAPLCRSELLVEIEGVADVAT
jgi:chorismate lyase / 3-hydroxybenzoate synthase